MRPVNPQIDNCPDYFDIIGHPMDLQTVRSKLESDSYKTIKEWKDDVNLIFDNSITYNTINSLYGLTALFLQEKFAKKSEFLIDDNIFEWNQRLKSLQKKLKSVVNHPPKDLPTPYYFISDIDQIRPKTFNSNNPKILIFRSIIQNDTSNQHSTKISEPVIQKSGSKSMPIIISNSDSDHEKGELVFNDSEININFDEFADVDDNIESEDDISEQEMIEIATEVNELTDDSKIEQVFHLLQGKEPELITSQNVDVEIQKFKPSTLRALRVLLNGFLKS